MRARLIAAALALAVLGGCSSVLNGQGRADLPGTSLPSAPPTSGASGSTAATSAAPTSAAPTSTSTSAPEPPTGCPRVVYAGARLSFDCIATGLDERYTPNRDAVIWPLRLSKLVERATGWVLEEGGGHLGSAQNATLAQIAKSLRQRMIDAGGYGESPAVHTVASRATTVDGARAYLLQTTIDINRSWAKQSGTKVRQERLWIIAIEVGTDDVSLWYASVPDLAKSLWSKVPDVIASIRVG